MLFTEDCKFCIDEEEHTRRILLAMVMWLMNCKGLWRRVKFWGRRQLRDRSSNNSIKMVGARVEGGEMNYEITTS